MADYYLEFEKPIQEIDLKIMELEADTSSADHSTELSKLKTKRNLSLKEIFSGLSRWQRVQLARHPQRPFSLDYIQFFSPDFIELHGDRYFSDDSAVICGRGSIEGVSVMFIGQQKGRNTKMLMLENTWYSVISPEGCASILWRDAAKAPDAADAMKVAPDDLMNMGICDRIVEEPLGGAHRNFDEMAETLKKVLLGELENLKDIEPNTFLERRISRYEKMGVYTES